MKIAGIVVEYNPFHNGHAYHLKETRRITGADYIIGVMSPDYVQRGVPAVFDKHTRTKMALAGGIDLILELPVSYATSSAEWFAKGAIAILHQLGCIDFCCFGSESGTLETFQEIAHILLKEPPAYQTSLQAHLRQGDSFPLARKKALCQYSAKDWSSFLSSPNNILGLEYVKQLQQLQSTVKPITIRRHSNQYHQEQLTGSISSATALRKELLNQANLHSLKDQFPDKVFAHLQTAISQTPPCHEDDFSLLLKYKLLQESPEHLSTYLDVSKDLAHRIINHLNNFQTFSQFAALLKTKDLTRTRINRALLHILLDLKSIPPITNIRILGFQESARPLLAHLKATATLPIITKITDQSYNPFPANLYSSIVTNKTKTKYKHEFSKSIQKLPFS